MSVSRLRSQVRIKTRENATETKCISRRGGTLAQKPLRSTGSNLATILVGRENKNNSKNK